MKSLIDKIIEKLTIWKDEQHNHNVRREFEAVIELIKKLEESAEFEEIARVMIKHLNLPQYHPHHTVIINSTSAELSEGKIAINIIFDYMADESVQLIKEDI